MRVVLLAVVRLAPVEALPRPPALYEAGLSPVASLAAKVGLSCLVCDGK
jgi:hypothetical protein